VIPAHISAVFKTRSTFNPAIDRGSEWRVRLVATHSFRSSDRDVEVCPGGVYFCLAANDLSRSSRSRWAASIVICCLISKTLRLLKYSTCKAHFSLAGQEYLANREYDSPNSSRKHLHKLPSPLHKHPLPSSDTQVGC